MMVEPESGSTGGIEWANDAGPLRAADKRVDLPPPLPRDLDEQATAPAAPESRLFSLALVGLLIVLTFLWISAISYMIWRLFT